MTTEQADKERSALYARQDKECVVVMTADEDKRIGLKCVHCGQVESFAVDVFGIAMLKKGNVTVDFEPMVHDDAWVNCLACYKGCGDSMHEHTVAEFRYELKG